MNTSTLLRLAVVARAPALLTACSTQSWYEGARVHAENECRRQPGSAAEECMARVNTQRYEDYERARKAQ